MRVCKSLWERGIGVGIEDCRRWLNFERDVRIPEELPRDPLWKPVVILNQVLQTNDPQVVLDRIGGDPQKALGIIANLRKYYPKIKSVEEVIEIPVEREPDYVDGTKGVVDFFLNYLRFEEGVDVDGLVEPLRKLLEKDQNVEEFLRLCGIDELITPEEFLRRVDKAVDVFVKAKEQGLDVEEILRKWDELANEGGSRFVYLEEAVKRVADEEVGRKFWEEVEKVLEGEGIKVSGVGDPSWAYRLFYLELVNLADGVDVSPFEGVLKKVATFLKKVRPIPLYTVEDIEKVFKIVGVESAVHREEVEKVAEVLEALDRFSSSYVFDNELPLLEIVKEVEDPAEKIAEIISKTVREGVLENMGREALIEYIKKRLSH